MGVPLRPPDVPEHRRADTDRPLPGPAKADQAIPDQAPAPDPRHRQRTVDAAPIDADEGTVEARGGTGAAPEVRRGRDRLARGGEPLGALPSAEPKDRPGYHILHFIGHGGYVSEAKEGVLLFEGKDGRSKRETGDKLGAILRSEDSLRLAVLNSCEGARASLNDPFSSVATSLIEHEIPAVIGMQFEITDRAAILFSGEFYRALADGRAVDESLSQARMAIFADNNDIEWGTPVLFMRVTDGRLFDVQASPEVAAPPRVVGPAVEGGRRRRVGHAFSRGGPIGERGGADAARR